MASDISLRTILIVREETRSRHIGYSFRLAARVLLYAPSHRQDSTYHGLCYTSRGALAGMGPPHEGSIRRPSHHERTLLPRSYISLLNNNNNNNLKKSNKLMNQYIWESFSYKGILVSLTPLFVYIYIYAETYSFNLYTIGLLLLLVLYTIP